MIEQFKENNINADDMTMVVGSRSKSINYHHGADGTIVITKTIDKYNGVLIITSKVVDSCPH